MILKLSHPYNQEFYKKKSTAQQFENKGVGFRLALVSDSKGKKKTQKKMKSLRSKLIILTQESFCNTAHSYCV